jgi:hypothetical protein
MKKPVPIPDAEAFDSSRRTHKYDDLIKQRAGWCSRL